MSGTLGTSARHYQRVVADLPCGGRQVTLHLQVRKFVCLNLACPRVIFAERFPDLVQPRTRHTMRLLDTLRALGFATSGEPAARLAPKVGLAGSPSTILRQIKATLLPPMVAATKVGLDDFAFRRGLCYGTIIVDLETHRVLDLLPDRTTATVAAWLKERPWIVLDPPRSGCRLCRCCPRRSPAGDSGGRQMAPAP